MPAFTLGNKQAKYMPILNVSDQKYVICFWGGGSKITVSCFKQGGGKPMKGMSNIFLRSY